MQTAANEPMMAAKLAGQEWTGTARFQYGNRDEPREDDNAWTVQFTDKGGKELAKVIVDLNAARPRGRRARATKQVHVVKQYSAAA